jgi:hypothetical protein
MDDLHLTEDIWKSVIHRLKRFRDDNFRMHRFVIKSARRFESNMTSTFPEMLIGFGNRNLKLLYRGSRDGSNSSDFHQKRDGESDTTIFIQTTKDFIFGGYIPLSWDFRSGYKIDSSHRSFVFTITHPHNFGPRQFAFKPGCAQRAIFCNSSYGPDFGGGGTISVSTNFAASNTNYTYLYDYVNDTGLDDSTVFTGEQFFTMKEIEVFALTE